VNDEKIKDLSLAKKEHQLEIPISDSESNIQLNIFLTRKSENRIGKFNFYADIPNNPNIGSVSIPSKIFLDLAHDEI